MDKGLKDSGFAEEPVEPTDKRRKEGSNWMSNLLAKLGKCEDDVISDISDEEDDGAFLLKKPSTEEMKEFMKKWKVKRYKKSIRDFMRRIPDKKRLIDLQHADEGRRNLRQNVLVVTSGETGKHVRGIEKVAVQPPPLPSQPGKRLLNRKCRVVLNGSSSGTSGVIETDSRDIIVTTTPNMSSGNDTTSDSPKIKLTEGVEEERMPLFVTMCKRPSTKFVQRSPGSAALVPPTFERFGKGLNKWRWITRIDYVIIV